MACRWQTAGIYKRCLIMVEIEYGQFRSREHYSCYITDDINGANEKYNTSLLKNNSCHNYISFDGDGINLDDSNLHFCDENDYLGFISADVSDTECNATGQIIIPCAITDLESGVAFRFYGSCCTEMYVKCKDVYGNYYFEETITVGDAIFNWSPPIEALSDDVSRIEFYFTKTALPYQFIKLFYVKFGKIIVLNKIKEAELLEQITVLSDDLPMNSFNFSVFSENDVNFIDEAPLSVFSNGRYYGTFYIDEAERVAKKLYSIKALNCLKFLDEKAYKEWCLGLKPEEFVKKCKEDTDIPIIFPNVANYTLFGHIPIESYRLVLCKIAFACCLMIDDSRRDYILLKPIPGRASSTITTADKRILGESTYTKNKLVSNAQLQYAYTYDTETKIIPVNFDPLTDAEETHRMTYCFEYPTRANSWVSSPSTLYANRGNYIDFETTLDDVEITTTALNYIYRTTQIQVEGDDKKNEIDFKELNLTAKNSLLQNPLVPNYKAEDIKKYMLSGGTIKAKIRLRNERIGDLIQIETAFDGLKTGIITSMSIRFGYEDVAEIEVLEWPIG